MKLDGAERAVSYLGKEEIPELPGVEWDQGES